MQETEINQSLKPKITENQIISEYPNVNIFKLIFFFADKYDIILLSISIIGGIVAGAIFPFYSLQLGNSIDEFGKLESNKLTSAIVNFSLSFIYLGLGILVASFFGNAFSQISADRYLKKLEIEYFQALLRQDQAYFDQKNPYEYATKVQSQLKTIASGLGIKVANTCLALSTFISSYIVGFITNWKFSLILLSIIPFIMLFSYLMIKTLMASLSKKRENFEKAGGIAEEILYNIKTVASFSNFSYEKERFNKMVYDSYSKGKFSNTLSAISNAFVMLFLFGSYALAIGVGGKMLSDGLRNNTTEITVGEIFTIIFTIIFGAINLGKATPNIQAISAACDASRELFYVYHRQPNQDLSNSIEKPDRTGINGTISFSNVTFAYPTKLERNIIKNLSYSFKNGKRTAIVGETGSGKSTIINLVERLYDPQEGVISIDNIDIKRFDISYFRSLIGYVQQEPVLFNRTIKENIIFGREGVTDDEIKVACDKAFVSEFVSKLENGLDTVVGIKGSKLSGGQKQRVAIARAILKRPKLLFLDEATSALDYKSEIYVKKALDSVSEGVTTIIIAHRLSTIINADEIVVLNKGEIEETGTHQSLLEKGGLYYNLIKSQQKKEEEEEKEKRKNTVQLEEEIKEEVVEVIKEEDKEMIIKKVFEEEKIVNEKAKKAKKYLWPILLEKKGILILSTFMACVSGAVFPVFGYLQAETIFKLSDSPLGKRTADEISKNSIFLSGMFLILSGVAAIATFLMNNLFNIMGEFIAMTMRKKVFEKYLSMHIGFFDFIENNPGGLLTKLSSDTLKINGVALSMFSILIETISTLLIGLIISFIHSWQLTLLLIGFLPLIVISGVLRRRYERGFSISDEVKEKEIGGFISECVVNTRVLFCFNMQNKAVDILKDQLEGVTPNKKKKLNMNSSYLKTGVMAGIGNFTTYLIFALSFFVGGKLIENQSINMGDLFKTIFVIMLTAFGLATVEQYVGDINESKKALISIDNILNAKTEIDPNEEGKIIPNKDTFKGKIQFVNVSFAYPTRQNTIIFKKLNLTIEPNTQNAFVGFSGSGKSSIIQLILRFYDPLSGEILIDDVNIKEYNIIELRKMIGLVMQEPFLFKTNVYNNILYGNLNSSSEEVLESARKAKVPRLDQVTINNTDALPVSGGEKQRIAIARCIIKNPKIILLDEATSALDKNTEEEIQHELDLLMKNKTSIVVAHRLSTIVNSDRIYFVEDGEIVEEGSHQELVNLKGKYYSLYKSSN